MTVNLKNWIHADNGWPLAGRTVNAYKDGETTPTATTTTDADGMWQFDALPDGSYEVEVVSGHQRRRYKGGRRGQFDEIAVTSAVTTDSVNTGTVTTDSVNTGTLTADSVSADDYFLTNATPAHCGLLQSSDLLLLDCQRVARIGTDISIVGSRGERAIVTGALHYEPGRWSGRRALVVEQATTNMIQNPRCALGVSYYDLYSDRAFTKAWAQNEGPGNILQNACLWTSTGGTGSGGQFQRRYNLGQALVAGQPYTLSFWARASSTKVVTSYIFNNVSPYPMVTNALQFAVTPTWKKVVLQFTASATGSTSNVIIFNTTDDPANFQLWMTGLQLEKLAFATSYCDGSLGAGYTWDTVGSPHASTSTRAATVVSLDAYAGLLSGRSQLTIHARVRVPYAATGTWPDNHNMVFDSRGADDNHRIFLAYLSANKAWYLYVNGGYRVSSRVQTFQAGDEITLDAVLDFDTDQYRLYVNGDLSGSASIAMSAPTLSVFRIGCWYSGAHYFGGFAFSEFAVFGQALTAGQVAALYQMQRPLVDSAATHQTGPLIIPCPSVPPSGLGVNPFWYDYTNNRFYVVGPDGVPRYSALT